MASEPQAPLSDADAALIALLEAFCDAVLDELDATTAIRREADYESKKKV